MLRISVSGTLSRHLADTDHSMHHSLQTRHVTVGNVGARGRNVVLRFTSASTHGHTRGILRNSVNGAFDLRSSVSSRNPTLVLTCGSTALSRVGDCTIGRGLAALHGHVTRLNIARTLMRSRNTDHVIIRLPNIRSATRTGHILNHATGLRFQVITRSDRGCVNNVPPTNARTFPFRALSNPPMLLRHRSVIANSGIAGTRANVSRDNSPRIDVALSDTNNGLVRGTAHATINGRVTILFVRGGRHVACRRSRFV